MKTRLIKLTDTHYIVVDDSEIEEGDLVLNPLNEIQTYFKDYNFVESKKITHSTQPLEEVKLLSLSEVEEAINGYSIYQKALDFTITSKSKIYIDDEKTHDEVVESLISFHKELVKDKLFTVEDIEQAMIEGLTIEQFWEKCCKLLLPKTEWDIEFDEQDKLKLI